VVGEDVYREPPEDKLPVDRESFVGGDGGSYDGCRFADLDDADTAEAREADAVDGSARLSSS